MSIESDIYDKLVTTAGVTALVSTRIYPSGDVPEVRTFPLITYHVAGETPNRAMGADRPTIIKTIQINSFAYLSRTSGSTVGARSIAEAVKAALNRWRGAGTTQTIHSMFFDESYDDYDSEMKLNFTVQRYRVFYQ